MTFDVVIPFIWLNNETFRYEYIVGGSNVASYSLTHDHTHMSIFLDLFANLQQKMN